jgi:hypothetical protein
MPRPKACVLKIEALFAANLAVWAWALNELMPCSIAVSHASGSYDGVFVIILGAFALALGAERLPDGSLRGVDVRETTVVLAQIIIRQTKIIRIPSAPTSLVPAPPRLTFKEKDAPKCIKWSNLAATVVSSPTTIDVIVRGGMRYRLKLEKSCQAIDFYQGFYVKPTADGQLCKDRDSIRSRAGGECGIDKFKTLVAEK